MSSLHNVVKTLMCSTSEDLECQSHICHASISNSSQYILRKKKKISLWHWRKGQGIITVEFILFGT